MAFNINAQVILSGPKNISAVTKQIKTQLKGISVPVNITIDKNIAKNLGNFNKGVKTLTSNLNHLSTASRKADTSIRSLVSGFRDLSTASTKISRSQSLIASSLGESTKAMREAGSELQQFGKDAALAIRRFTAFTVATGVVFGFVRAVQQATGAAIEYEREIVKVVQVTGASAGKIGRLKRTIDDLSVSLGVDANELAVLSRTFAQTGQTIDQVRDSIRAVARSSLAPSFGTMKNTAEGLIAAMAQFNIAADKSEQVLGSLNAVSKRFAVEAEDLISVIRRAGGVFSTAAGHMRDPQEALQELAGIFVAVRSTTRESADTIATGLRTIFTRIQRRGTIDFLKQFNIELIDAKGNFIGLFPAFQQLEKGLKGLIQSGDAISLSAVTEELGGIRQVGKLIPAIVNFNKALAATKIAAQGAAEGLGKDVQLALQPLGKQFEMVATRFNSLIRTISESKTFQNLAKVAISTANAFLSVAEALTPLIPLITTLTTIKLTKGLFEFGKGFVGGLKKGGGAGGAGGALGGAITGGGGGPTGGAPGVKAGVDKVLAQALRNNVTAVRSNTTSLDKVNTSLMAVHRNIELLGQTFMNETRKLIVAMGTVNPGFKPTKFARGGPVHGPSHAAGGVPAILEGGEYVIPKGYVTGGEVFDITTAQIKSGGMTGRKVARGSRRPEGKGRSFGVAYLRPEGMDKTLTFNLTASDFKGTTGGEILQKLPGSEGKTKTAKLYTELIRKTGRAQKGGVIPITLEQGSLSKKVADDFEKALRFSTLRMAKETLEPAIGSGSFNARNYLKGLKKANFEQSAGNFFEAALGATTGKWDEKRVNANAPFDYPSGLGNAAAAYKIPSGIPTDAKRSLSNETLGNLIKKARNQIMGEVVSSQVVQGMEKEFKGDSFDTRASLGIGRLQTLVGRSTGSFDELMPIYKGLGFRIKDLNPKGKGGGSGYRVTKMAAGGSIFAPQGTDTVPAMLTPGEYVINRSSAQAIGYGQLDKMNRMAAGGRVQYLHEGGPATSATTSRRSDMGGTSGGLIDKFGALTVVVGGVTTAFAGLDITSMTSVLSSAASLAFTFQQLAFFAPGVSQALLGGIGGKLGATGIGRNVAASFGQVRGGLGAAGAAFGSIPRGPSPGMTGGGLFGPRAIPGAPIKGFTGFLKRAGAGLSAFTKSIGGVTGFFKGLPGLLTSLIAAPIVNASLDKAFGKVEEIAPGVRGRRGMSATGGGLAAGAGGAITGGLTGAAIGSLIPVVGTAVGAAVGAIGGAISSGLSAFFEQDLFNAFDKVKSAGDDLAGTLEKVNRLQGKLDEATTKVFGQQTNALTKALADSLKKTTETMTLFAGNWEGFGIEGNVQKQIELTGKILGEAAPEIKATLEALDLALQVNFGRALEGNKDLLNDILKVDSPLFRDANRGAFGSSQSMFGSSGPGVIEWEGLLRGMAFGGMPPAAEPSGLQRLDVDPSLGEQGSLRRTLSKWNADLGEFGAEMDSGITAFSQLNALFRQSLADAPVGGGRAQATRAFLDQQSSETFLKFIDQFNSQLQALQTTNTDESLASVAAMRTGMKNLTKATDIQNLSNANLAQVSQEVYEKTLQDITGKDTFAEAQNSATEAQKKNARLVLKQLGIVTGESAERRILNAEMLRTVELQRQAARTTKFFSLELQKLVDTVTTASTEFGNSVSDAKSDIDILLGGKAKFRPLNEKFTGSDAQFKFLEQGGPQATSLRGLSDLGKQLPAIVKRTVMEQQEIRATGQKVDATDLTTALRANITQAVPHAPGPAVDQVLAALGGSVDRQGKTVVDSLDKLATRLVENAGDIDILSPLVKDAEAKTSVAFDKLISVYNAYGSFLEQRNRIEMANIARTVAFGRKLDQVNDQISGMLGGRGPSQAEERSRRQRDLTRISGAPAGVLPMGAGGQMGILQAERNILLGRKGQFEKTPDNQKTQQLIKANAANDMALNRVTDAIKSLNDTMDKELTAALNALQRTINEQIQAESGIQSLTDVALAISKGEMSVFEAEERFGPLLRAVEELKNATATGRQANFSLEGAARLQRGIATEDPLIMGLIRQMARQRAPGNPGEWVQQLRHQLAQILGNKVTQTLGAQGVAGLAAASKRITQEHADSTREIGARRGGVAGTMAERQAANQAQSQGMAAGAASITASTEQQFAAAVGDFAKAVAAFETALADRPQKEKDMAKDVGGNNRGGLIQNFAKGGMVRGPSHAAGGVLTELEGGEFVIPKKFVNGGPVGPRESNRFSGLGMDIFWYEAADGELLPMSKAQKDQMEKGEFGKDTSLTVSSGQFGLIPKEVVEGGWDASKIRTRAQLEKRFGGGTEGSRKVIGLQPAGNHPLHLEMIEKGNKEQARRDAEYEAAKNKNKGGAMFSVPPPPLPTPRPGQYPPSAGPFDAPPAPPGPRTMTRGERGAPPPSQNWVDFFPARPNDREKDIHPRGGRIMAPANLFPGAPVTAKASKPTGISSVAELKQLRDLEQQRVDDRHKFMSSPLQTADTEMIQAEQEGLDAVELLKRKRKAAAAKAVEDQKKLAKELNEKRAPGLQTLTYAEAQARWGSAGSPASQRTAARGRDQFGTLVWDLEGGETREEFDKRLKKDRARLQRQKRTDEVVEAIRAPHPVTPSSSYEPAPPPEGLKPRWQRDEEKKKQKNAAYFATLKKSNEKKDAIKERRARVLAMGRGGKGTVTPNQDLMMDLARQENQKKERLSKGLVKRHARELSAVNARRAKRGLEVFGSWDALDAFRKKGRAELAERSPVAIDVGVEAAPAAARRDKTLPEILAEARVAGMEARRQGQLRRGEKAPQLAHIRAIESITDPLKRDDARQVLSRIRRKLESIGLDYLSLGQQKGKTPDEGLGYRKFTSIDEAADSFYGRHKSGAFGEAGVFPHLDRLLEKSKAAALEKGAALGAKAKQDKIDDESRHRRDVAKREAEHSKMTEDFERAKRENEAAAAARGAKQLEIKARAEQSVRRQHGLDQGPPDTSYRMGLTPDEQQAYDRQYDLAKSNLEFGDYKKGRRIEVEQARRKAWNQQELSRASAGSMRGGEHGESSKYSAGYYMVYPQLNETGDKLRLGPMPFDPGHAGKKDKQGNAILQLLKPTTQRNIFDETDVLSVFSGGKFTGPDAKRKAGSVTGLSFAATARGVDVLGGRGMKTEKRGYTTFEAQQGAPVDTFTTEQLAEYDKLKRQQAQTIKEQVRAKQNLNVAQARLAEIKHLEGSVAWQTQRDKVRALELHLVNRNEQLRFFSEDSYLAEIEGRTAGGAQWNIQRLRDPRDSQNYINDLKKEEQESIPGVQQSRKFGVVDRVLKGITTGGPKQKEGYEGDWLDQATAMGQDKVLGGAGNLWDRVKRLSSPVQESLVIGTGFVGKFLNWMGMMTGATGMNQMEYASMQQSLDENIDASLAQLEGVPSDFKDYIRAEWERTKNRVQSSRSDRTGKPLGMPLRGAMQVVETPLDMLFGDRPKSEGAGLSHREEEWEAYLKQRKYEVSSKEAQLEGIVASGGADAMRAQGELNALRAREHLVTEPSLGAVGTLKEEAGALLVLGGLPGVVAGSRGGLNPYKVEGVGGPKPPPLDISPTTLAEERFFARRKIVAADEAMAARRAAARPDLATEAGGPRGSGPRAHPVQPTPPETPHVPFWERPIPFTGPVDTALSAIKNVIKGTPDVARGGGRRVGRWWGERDFWGLKNPSSGSSPLSEGRMSGPSPSAPVPPVESAGAPMASATAARRAGYAERAAEAKRAAAAASATEAQELGTLLDDVAARTGLDPRKGGAKVSLVDELSKKSHRGEFSPSDGSIRVKRGIRDIEGTMTEEIYHALDHANAPRVGSPTGGFPITRSMRPGQPANAIVEMFESDEMLNKLIKVMHPKSRIGSARHAGRMNYFGMKQETFAKAARAYHTRGPALKESIGDAAFQSLGEQLELVRANKPAGFNKGGFVPGYNQGGNVDSVHAKLTPGEYVMRRESVQKYGEKFMNDVNLQKLNNGGTVGAPAVGASTGGTKVSKSKDLERGAKMAGDSILNAFIEGSRKAADAIKEALSPDNLAAQIGDVVGQKMQESIAATEIKMTTTSQVNLTGDGATGDMARKVEGTIKDAIAGAFNNRTNVDGSAKDPSLHRDSLA